MTALREPEGDPAAASRWKVSERNGGWDAVGMDGHEIVYECLHLHGSRSLALACGCESMPDTPGPSQ